MLKLRKFLKLRIYYNKIKKRFTLTTGKKTQELFALKLRNQVLEYNLHHPQYLKKNMVEKISVSGLAFDDLKMVHSKYVKYGKEGLIAILSKPPTSS